MLHDLIDFHNPMIASLLFVQLVGFPIAFLIRAVLQTIQAFRAPISERHEHRLRAIGNLCFALTSLAFYWVPAVGVTLFLTGVGLSLMAFQDKRRRTAPLTKPILVSVPTVSIRNSKLSRRK